MTPEVRRPRACPRHARDAFQGRFRRSYARSIKVCPTRAAWRI